MLYCNEIVITQKSIIEYKYDTYNIILDCIKENVSRETLYYGKKNKMCYN